MHRTVGPVVWLATLSVCGSAFADAPPASRPLGRIGIAAFGPASLPVDLRIRLEDAAAAGVKASGGEVISAADLARARANAALGNCSDSLCERRLAQVTDTRYWLRGTVQLDTSTYRLHLELVDARTGAVAVARDDTCDICTDADAAETVNVAASALKAALGRLPAPPHGSPGAPGHAPAPSPPGAGVAQRDPRAVLGGGDKNDKNDKNTGITRGLSAAELGPRSFNDLKHEELPRRPVWKRLLPWAAFAAAAGAGVAGAIYLAIDGNGSRCDGGVDGWCRFYNDTTWSRGVPLLAVSAVFAATGIVLLRLGGGTASNTGVRSQDQAAPPAEGTKIVVSLGRLSVIGSF